MDDSHYDLAQICENGHVANSSARDYPISNQDHCDKCGSRTITACPACETEIRGRHHVPDVIRFQQVHGTRLLLQVRGAVPLDGNVPPRRRRNG